MAIMIWWKWAIRLNVSITVHLLWICLCCIHKGYLMFINLCYDLIKNESRSNHLEQSRTLFISFAIHFTSTLIFACRNTVWFSRQVDCSHIGCFLRVSARPLICGTSNFAQTLPAQINLALKQLNYIVAFDIIIFPMITNNVAKGNYLCDILRGLFTAV